MRYKYIGVIMLLLIGLSLYGQQQKTVSMTAQPQKTEVQVLEETVSQLQLENQTMQKQLENLEKEVGIYREDVRAKEAAINEDQGHWLTLLSIVIGAIVLILGVGVPWLINNKSEKYIEKILSDAKQEASSAKEQADTAKTQAGTVKESVDEVQKQVSFVKQQVTAAMEQAKNVETAVVQVKSQIEETKKQVSFSTNQAMVATDQAKKAETALVQIMSQVEAITVQTAAATQQAMVATEKATRAEKVLADIEELKRHVDTIEKKINEDAVAAENASREAQANRWFTQALSEKDPSKAIELYTKVIELKPDFEAAFYNRGMFRAEMKDFTGAMEDYNEAIKLDPNDSDAYNNRADLWLEMGETEKALEDINTAIRIDNKSFILYVTRGEVYIAMGEIHKALADFNYALSTIGSAVISNDDIVIIIEAYETRAKCYRKLAEEEQDPEKQAEWIAKAEADEQKAASLK